MIQIIRLVTQKHLLMSSKIKKKELEDKIKKLKGKTKKSTTNQITNNFEKNNDKELIM